MEWYKVRDPVYGFIEFNEWEKAIISHPAFQRLRRIKQLGLTDMVYPGAMHTRFEHSLGVMHLITKMFDSIMKKEENMKVLEKVLQYDKSGLQRERQVVRLAGLLHDIGHAPFSHASEELMPKNTNTGKSFKHEDYSSAIIKSSLKEVIEQHPINRANYKIKSEEIADLIKGKPVGGSNIFWRILISSQLDADRCDYLLRDSVHIGVKYGVYDLDRLLVTLRLGVEPENNEVILGIEEGGIYVAEGIIISRYQMFTQVYYHKTRRAYDLMLRDALKHTFETYPSPDKVEEFIQIDDYKAWHMMQEKKSLLINDIIGRNHIRLIKETREDPSDEERREIDLIKTKLSKEKIQYWEDFFEKPKSWYSVEDDEIRIISKEGNIKPLSEYSKIVKSLRMGFGKIRIYVKSEDRNKSLEIIQQN